MSRVTQTPSTGDSHSMSSRDAKPCPFILPSPMKNRMLVVMVAFWFVSLVQLKAHDVLWMNNEYGFETNNPVVLDPFLPLQWVEVAPSEGEDCTVIVGVDK